MRIVKKTVSCILATAAIVTLAAVNASAATFTVGTATATATLTATSIPGYLVTATATTSLNRSNGSVSVSVYGEYYKTVNGVLKTLTTGNGGSGTTGVSASISNTSSEWVFKSSGHTATYGTYSKSIVLF